MIIIICSREEYKICSDIAARLASMLPNTSTNIAVGNVAAQTSGQPVTEAPSPAQPQNIVVTAKEEEPAPPPIPQEQPGKNEQTEEPPPPPPTMFPSQLPQPQKPQQPQRETEKSEEEVKRGTEIFKELLGEV